MKLCELFERLTDEEVEKCQSDKFYTYNHLTKEVIASCPLAILGEKLGLKPGPEVNSNELFEFFNEKYAIDENTLINFYSKYDRIINQEVVSNKEAIDRACKSAEEYTSF